MSDKIPPAVYKIIRDIMASNLTYQQMLDRLTQEGLDREDAEKLLDRILFPENDEDDNA